jgi:hypothetical protein
MAHAFVQHEYDQSQNSFDCTTELLVQWKNSQQRLVSDALQNYYLRNPEQLPWTFRHASKCQISQLVFLDDEQACFSALFFISQFIDSGVGRYCLPLSGFHKKIKEFRQKLVLSIDQFVQDCQERVSTDRDESHYTNSIQIWRKTFQDCAPSVKVRILTWLDVTEDHIQLMKDIISPISRADAFQSSVFPLFAIILAQYIGALGDTVVLDQTFLDGSIVFELHQFPSEKKALFPCFILRRPPSNKTHSGISVILCDMVPIHINVLASSNVVLDDARSLFMDFQPKVYTFIYFFHALQ